MRKVLAFLGLALVALLCIGFVVMSSASMKIAQEHPDYGGDLYYFLKRQGMWLAAALVIGIFCYCVDYHCWKKLRFVFFRKIPVLRKIRLLREIPLLPVLFYLGVAFLLTLTLVPPFRTEINGSFRWLVLTRVHIPFRIQPGELAKLATIVVIAVWMDILREKAQGFWRGVFVPVLLLGGFAALLFGEKDLGATAVTCVLGIALMFVAGMKWRYLLGAVGMLASLGTLWIWHDAHRKGRIMSWWSIVRDPLSDNVRHANYHLYQSIRAFRSGGLKGVGFNQSIQKHFFLPEAHTDFVFAIGAEEGGFYFSIAVLALYAVVLGLGIWISLRAPDRLGRLLAFGMTMLLVFQAALNIGVVTGVLPTKGLALPFMSYGGTNLVVALFAVGTLFNIGKCIVKQENTTVVRDALGSDAFPHDMYPA